MRAFPFMFMGIRIGTEKKKRLGRDVGNCAGYCHQRVEVSNLRL